MKKNKRKGQHVGLVFLLSIAFVVGSTSMVLASGYQAGYWYGQLFRATVIDIEEPYVPPVFEEYEDTVDVNAVVFEIGEVEELVEGVASSGSISWTLDAGEGLKTEDFYVAAGSTISVLIGSPTGNTLRVGIYRPNNTRSYVEGSSVAHDFSITASGNYSVFVENISSSSSGAMGYYYTH